MPNDELVGKSKETEEGQTAESEPVFEVDPKRIEEMIDGAVQAVGESAERLANQIKEDVAIGVAPADFKETIAEITTIVSEAETIGAKSKKGIFETLGLAFEDKLRQRKEQKLREQLAIPDNPKVLKKLQAALSRLKKERNVWVDKENVRRRKAASNVYFSYQDLREEYFFGKDDKLSKLMGIAETFKNAKKSSEFKWKSVKEETRELVEAAALTAMRQKNFELFARLWELIPDLASEQFVSKAMDTYAKDYYAGLEQYRTNEFNLNIFFRKKEFYENFARNIPKALRENENLLLAVEDLNKKIKNNTFRAGIERKLSEQPKLVLDNLKALPPEDQECVLEKWQSYKWSKCEPGEKSLGDLMVNPRHKEMISLIRELPKVDAGDNFYESLSDIFEMDSNARESAWQKIKPILTDPNFKFNINWQDVSSYFRVGGLKTTTTEQIEKLSPVKVSLISTIGFAYTEERSAVLCTDDNIDDLAKNKSVEEGNSFFYRNPAPHILLARFARNLGPKTRDFLQAVEIKPYYDRSGKENDPGLVQYIKIIEQFEQLVVFVPVDCREDFFGALTPSVDMPSYGMDYRSAIKNETIKNYIEYATICQPQDRLTFSGFCYNADYFSDEKWPIAKKGMAELAGIDNAGKWLRVFERAGQPNSDKANKLARMFMGKGKDIMKSHYQGTSKTLDERNHNDALALYKFADACEEHFSQDKEQMFEYLMISERDRKLINAFLDGSLFEDRDYIDLPILEGQLLVLNDDFNRTRPILELYRFRKLPLEQKKLFCDLQTLLGVSAVVYSNTSSQLLDLVVTNQGERLRAFLEMSKLSDFTLSALLKMAERPDCVGLFYFLKPNHYNDPNLPAIDKLIALKDGGLSASFFLSCKPEKTDSRRSFGDGECLKWFMEWDIGKLLKVAQEASQINPAFTFIDVVSLPSDASEDELTRALRSATLLKSNHLCHYLNLNGQFTDEQLANFSARESHAEKKLGVKLDDRQMHCLTAMSDAVWDKIKEDKTVLQYAIEKQYIPDSVAGLDGETLHDPLFWSLKLYEDVSLSSNELVLSALTLAKRLADQNIIINPEKKKLSELIEIQNKAPWLFEKNNMALFQNDVYLIKDFSVYSETEFNEFKKFLKEYRLGSFDYDNFVEIIRRDNEILPQDTVAMIVEKIDFPIPWGLVCHFRDHLAKGETAEEIIAQLDNGEHSHYGGFNWQELRVQHVFGSLKDKTPNFFKQVGASLFHADRDGEIFAGLDEMALERLERLAPLINIYGYDEKAHRAAIAIVSHKNFETILDFFTAVGGTRNLLADEPAHLISFCDRLNSSIVDSYRNMPPDLGLLAKDAVDFFCDPAAEKTIDFALKLREIFGDKFSINIYGVLMMDFEKDAKIIGELQEHCFNKLDAEELENLLLITEGETRAVIQKILSMNGSKVKIDPEIAILSLGKMSPALRLAAFKAKGQHCFGTKIIKYHHELADIGIKQDDVDDLVDELYRADRNDSFNEIDYETAVVLLRRARDDEKEKRIKSILRFCNPGDKSLSALLFPDHLSIVARIASSDWVGIGFGLKSSLSFWESLRDFDPTILLAHHNEWPTGFSFRESDWLFLLNDRCSFFVKYYDLAPDSLKSTEHQNKIYEWLNKHPDSEASINIIKLYNQNKLDFSPDQQKIIVNSFLETRKDPMEILEWHVKGIFTLTDEEEARAIDQLIINNIYVGHLFESSNEGGRAIKSILKKRVGQFIENNLDDAEKMVCVFERMLEANLLTDEYYEKECDILKNIINRGDLNNELLIHFAKTISSHIAMSGQPGAHPASDKNWLSLLFSFVNVEEFNFGPKNVEIKDKIREIFKGKEIKDFCFESINKIWNEYLCSKEGGAIPPALILLSNSIVNLGAGPLSQIEAISTFIHSFSKVAESVACGKTQKRTEEEVVEGARKMEGRFAKERWDRENQTNFYNISNDIIGAAPSLFPAFIKFFEKLKPAQMSRFMTEIFPLYRAKLALLEKGSGQGKVRQYRTRDLARCRMDIREMAREFSIHGVSAFDDHRNKLIGNIREIFKQKFGITRTAENFSDENLRSLVNFSIYTANLHGRTTVKEVILGFYLALNINDKWESFRRGEEINPDDYLVPEKSAVLKQRLAERAALNNSLYKQAGVETGKIPQFNLIFQQETQNVVIGSVETIDVKLSNVLNNLHDLCDLDLYPDPLQKACMGLLLEYGNKRVGAVASKMYQEIANPSRPIQYKENEPEIRDKINTILGKNRLQVTADTIKKYFQDEVKPLATIVNLLNFTTEVSAEKEIDEIRKLLVPTVDVVKIFNSLSEEFKPTSGAIAVAQDLDYLDNLVIKRGDDLREGERELLTNYIGQIRTQLIKLEDIYEKVKTKFASLKQSNSNTTNTLFKTKLDEVDRIINSQISERPIVSTMTGSINSIIENIRECLSCRNQGCNNDTNLTFGDNNKFFIYSRADGQKKDGSIADQIVFVEPIKYSDGTSDLAFVFDRIYGANTPTILINHIAVVFKKYRELKKQFPDSQLAIVIPKAIISFGVISENLLREKLTALMEKNLEIAESEVAIDVVASAMGDHYVEFGGEARIPGKRNVSALVLKIK